MKQCRGATDLHHVAFSSYERANGFIYVDPVTDASSLILKSALREYVSIETTGYSDTHGAYWGLESEFAGNENLSY